jgi:malonate transporter and related proteins
VTGYYILHAFQVTGPQFRVAMIFFALPTSPNNYILSVLLDSDVGLATSSIVLSILLSMVALSVTLMILEA